jgi:hypothetical protein
MSAQTQVMKLASEKPLQLALAVALLIGVVYYLGRKTIADAAAGLGGIVSGDNALTEGTDYQGAGVAGTLGAATNAASGGLLAEAGSWIGGKVFDIFHPSAGLMQTFIVNFPDGSKHAVNSEDIDSSGRFLYAGRRYQLVTDGAGMKSARLV